MLVDEVQQTAEITDSGRVVLVDEVQQTAGVTDSGRVVLVDEVQHCPVGLQRSQRVGQCT